MLRKRIIFTLIYNNGVFTQSRNFRLQAVGDINWLERNYKFQSIAFSLDELIVLNASRNDKNISDFSKSLSRLVDNVFIPIAAGGRIRTLEDAKLLFNNGADKIILNTALYSNKALVSKLVKLYGSQSILASIDYKTINGIIKIFIKNGTQELPLDYENYIKYIDKLNIGEIYLNSMDNDGTGFGYDFDAINSISKFTCKPIIIAGGAGNERHLIDGLNNANVSAVATANLFNFVGDGLPRAREKILDLNLNITKWTSVPISSQKTSIN